MGTARKKSTKKSTKKPTRPAAKAAVGKKNALRRNMHHNVYVVELSRDVCLEPSFRKSNPHYDLTHSLPCVYVGMTGLSPDVRFDKHKAGIQAGRFVQRYGLRLLPQLYECYNPMPYEGARDMEVELAIALREQGYGVWQA